MDRSAASNPGAQARASRLGCQKRGWFWWLGPVVFAALVALGAAAPYPASGDSLPPAAPPSQAAPSPGGDDNKEAALSALQERIKGLEADQKALFLFGLDGQRKAVDWWLAFLAVMVGVLALGGAIIPYLMGRKDQEAMKLALDETRMAKEEMRRLLEQAREDAKATEGHRKALEDAARKLQQPSSETQSPEDRAEVLAAADQVENNPDASLADRMRARAWKSERGGEESYRLWAAVAALDPGDAVANFNAGLAAQLLAEKAPPESRAHWWHVAGGCYEAALGQDSNFHEAANNWGIVLMAEAESLVATDPASAHRLWSLAGAKYGLALEINADYSDAANNWGVALAAEAKGMAGADLARARSLWFQAGEKYKQALLGDKHEAACNWGNALAAEAAALSATDPDSAHRLWSRAGEKYGLALQLKEDKHDAANHWGNALAAEAMALATALATADLAGARSLWSQAGEKYDLALQIKGDKHEAAYNWGNALAAEAAALAATDPTSARRLWSLAGEKYALALHIKPDYHYAAVSWGKALLSQYYALRPSDQAAASVCLHKARELLTQLAPTTPQISAYNLAGTYAIEADWPQAKHWLEVAKNAGTLPSRAHIETDPDFAPLADNPDFQAWLASLDPGEAT